MDSRHMLWGILVFMAALPVVILFVVSQGYDSSPSFPDAEPQEALATLPIDPPLPLYPSGYGCIAQEGSNQFADGGYWDCLETLAPSEQEHLGGTWFDAFGYPNVDEYGRDWYTPGETQLWWDEEKACGLHWQLGYPSAAELRGPNFPDNYQAANSDWSVRDSNDERAHYLFVRLSFLSPDVRMERCEGIFGEGAFIDFFKTDDEYFALLEQKARQEEREAILIDQLNRAMGACPSYQYRFLDFINDGRERLAYRLSQELEEADHSGGIAAELQILTVYNNGIENDILRVETTCRLR